MGFSNEKKCLIKITALVALLQGIVWLSLCIVALVVIQYPPKYLKEKQQEFTKYLSSVIYQQYLDGSNDDEGRIITHKSFIGILWMYIVLSAFWIGASIDQYAAIKSNHKRQKYLSVTLGVIILITSVIDIICASLFARDFSLCQPNPVILSDQTVRCKVSTGIMMTLIARGFVLLLLNTVMSLVLIVFGIRELHTPSLMTYGQSTIPRIAVQAVNKPDRTMNSSNRCLYDDKYYPGSNSFGYNTPTALAKIRNSSNYY